MQSESNTGVSQPRPSPRLSHLAIRLDAVLKAVELPDREMERCRGEFEEAGIKVSSRLCYD